MRKGVIVVLLVFCAWPALATQTRLSAMGGKEKGWTVVDETNVFFFPATLLLHRDLAYVDAGLTPLYGAVAGDGANIPYDVGFGLHFAFSDKAVLAFYGSSMSRYQSGPLLDRAFSGTGLWAGMALKDDEFSASDISGNQAIHNADHKGTLLFATQLGALRLGVSAAIWGDAYSIDEPETQYRRKGGTWFQGGLGGGYDLASGGSVDFGLQVHTGFFDDEKFYEGDLVTRLKSEGGTGFQLFGRGIFALASGNRVIPYLQLGYDQAGVAWNRSGGTSASAAAFGATAGVDLEVTPLEKTRILPGVGLGLYTNRMSEEAGGASSEPQDELTLAAPYVGVAVDSRVASWCSLRFGARQTVLFTTRYHNADGIAKGKDNDTLTEVTMGAAFHLGPVDVELLLDPGELLDGLAEQDSGPAVVVASAGEDGQVLFETTGGPAADEPGHGFISQLGLKFTW